MCMSYYSILSVCLSVYVYMHECLYVCIIYLIIYLYLSTSLTDIYVLLCKDTAQTMGHSLQKFNRKVGRSSLLIDEAARQFESTC